MKIAPESGNQTPYPQNATALVDHAKGMRHDFSPATRITIAERSGYKCANPDCRCVTVGPSLVDPDRSARVGMAAHIHAAAPGGPRYLKVQTEEERRSAENGLWMCESCGKIIDSDDSAYSAEELKEWKRTAERRAKAEHGLAIGKALFRLRGGDQTMYINLPRFNEMAIANGFHLSNLPPFNRPLLDSEGQLASIVLALEGVLEEMRVEATPISHVKTEEQCDAIVGQLISFRGRFRSRNAPRLKGGRVPEYHPTGDPKRDHVAWKKFGAVELILPLDSFWFASQSSVGFFRGTGYIAVHGIARVHQSTEGRIIASPVWMALPGNPLFD